MWSQRLGHNLATKHTTQKILKFSIVEVNTRMDRRKEREKSQMTFLVRRSDQVETSGLTGLPSAFQRPVYAMVSDEPSWGAGSWLSGEKCGRLSLSTQVNIEGWIPALTLDPSMLGAGAVYQKSCSETGPWGLPELRTSWCVLGKLLSRV